MFERLLIVSRSLNLLLAVYLIVNAVIAVRQSTDPAQRFGRISLGLLGLGMLCLQANWLLGGRVKDVGDYFEMVGAVLMSIGAFMLVRMFWKFPDVRHRSVDLFSFKS